MTEITQRLSTALANRYKLERHIGEGGMATVYLAHDLKHDRKVAVKVLRPELAAILGGERFLNEIKVTAGLQHPHILPLHDSGEADSFLYYVMPYIEGESLRDKLDRDKQLTVEETVEIAKAVASALDYAHEQGIVHRDIKPDNILLQRGQAIVADFGIALAVSQAGGTRLTETGLSLGTPHYMSPEQATGDRQLDARSDIYSLGAIVYEMLTGEPPHIGNSVQAIIAKILSEKPSPITQSRDMVPVNVDAAVHQALAKSPADRFRSAGRFAEALTNPAFTLPTAAAIAPAAAHTGVRWDRLGPIGFGLAGLFLIVAIWALAQPEPPKPVTRLSIRLADEQSISGGGTFDVSADGSLLVYEGPSSDIGVSRLWARRWDALVAAPISDTEGGVWPAASPDGREVAVIRSRGIRVVPIQGGVFRTLAADEVRCCVRWSPDGVWIYFDHLEAGVARVPSAGGLVEILMPADTAFGTIGSNIYVDVLPGGNGFLYEATTARGTFVASYDLKSGEVKMLSQGQFPRYSEGYVLFGTPDGGTLMAAPLDLGSLEFDGVATPVAEGLATPSGGWNYFSLSETGRLVYSLGSRDPPSYEIVSIDRAGRVTPVDPNWTFDPGSNNRGLALSPDGTKLALTVLEDANYDIWVKELPRGPASRLTFEDGIDVRPRWMPDGETVTFLSDRSSGPNNPAVFGKRAAGTGVAQLLFDHAQPLWEALFSPDAEWLIARTGGSSTIPGGRDVWAIRPQEDSTSIPLIVTGFDEKAIALSDDGRWLAYESDETGRNEIYVRPFPDVDTGKWLVSTGGGVMPVWAHSSQELFYINASSEMVSVEIRTGATSVAGDRTVLFSVGAEMLFRQTEQYSLYDVTPDDQGFIMLRAVNLEVSEPELIVVDNWSEELKARAGNE